MTANRRLLSALSLAFCNAVSHFINTEFVPIRCVVNVLPILRPVQSAGSLHRCLNPFAARGLQSRLRSALPKPPTPKRFPVSPDEFWISRTIEQRANRRRRREFVLRSLLLPAFAAAVYGGTLGIAVLVGCPPRVLIEDSVDAGSHCIMAGLISNVGIVFWMTAGVVCLFAVLSRSIDDRRNRQLIAAGGLLTAALTVDDLFRIHNTLVPKPLCYGAYALSAGLILLCYRREIVRLDSSKFLLAGAYLGLSILTDLFENQLPYDYLIVQIFEDGFKFVGIATWCAFWISAVMKARSQHGRRFVRVHVS